MSDSRNSLDIVPVLSEIRNKHGSTFFLDPMFGNHGDSLILMGCQRLLDNVSIQREQNIAEADVIALNGGGAMTDLYPTGLAKIKRYSDAYPDKPLVIMPSSFDFESTDFAGLFQGRTAPAYVFAREKYSCDIVANTEYPSEVHCYLAEDLAFQLAGSRFIQDLQGECSDDLILLVERCDVEGKRRFMGGGRVRKRWTRVIPTWLKYPVKRFRADLRAKAPLRMTPFEKEALQIIREKHEDLAALPTYAADISNKDVVTFAKCTNLVSRSAITFTTRMHIAILGVLLGKTVYIKKGLYHKIRGVYELSLQPRGNCHLY